MHCKAFTGVLRSLNELVYYSNTFKPLISLMVAVKSLVKGLILSLSTISNSVILIRLFLTKYMLYF